MTHLITLKQWNNQTFNGRYTSTTLSSWAKKGYIYPPAEKIGRDWMVTEHAVYRKPAQPIKIPANVDLELQASDPVVLSILNG